MPSISVVIKKGMIGECMRSEWLRVCESCESRYLECDIKRMRFLARRDRLPAGMPSSGVILLTLFSWEMILNNNIEYLYQ